MLLALGVRKVAAFVGVQGETEATFQPTEVVFEQVRVFGEIDGLKGELAESISSIDVTLGTAGYARAFVACSGGEVHLEQRDSVEEIEKEFVRNSSN